MCPGNVHHNQEEQRANDELPILEPLIEWPLERDEHSYVWCCQTCFYPIARFGDCRLLRRNSNIIGLVMSVYQMLTEDLSADYGRIITHSWMCRIFCFNCGLQLSFTEVTVPNVLRNFVGGPERVVLNFQLVTIGSTYAMAQRFIPIAR